MATAPTPTLHDRVLVIEGEIKPLAEFRRWAIAIVGGGILALAAAGVAYGTLVERLDHVAQDVQELRRDLNLTARGGLQR